MSHLWLQTLTGSSGFLSEGRPDPALNHWIAELGPIPPRSRGKESPDAGAQYGPHHNCPSTHLAFNAQHPEHLASRHRRP